MVPLCPFGWGETVGTVAFAGGATGGELRRRLPPLPYLSRWHAGPSRQSPRLRREPSMGRAIVWAAPVRFAGRRSFGPAQQWLWFVFLFVLLYYFTDLCTYWKICNSSLVDPNIMVLILLSSWSCLVFNKNIIWAHVLEIFEELIRTLKCVFRCMQTCLNFILSSCGPKIMKFCGQSIIAC